MFVQCFHFARGYMIYMHSCFRGTASTSSGNSLVAMDPRASNLSRCFFDEVKIKPHHCVACKKGRGRRFGIVGKDGSLELLRLHGSDGFICSL